LLAYDYPILGLFWTMFMFFLWFAWIMLLFRVFGDIFRSDDMGGMAKALWSLFVLLVPFLGVFIYVMARGQAMSQRDLEEARDREASFRTYVQGAASGGTGAADELSKLADLHARGVLTDEEFARQKTKLLS
jgi:hypothetical protein